MLSCKAARRGYCGHGASVESACGDGTVDGKGARWKDGLPMSSLGRVGVLLAILAGKHRDAEAGLSRARRPSDELASRVALVATKPRSSSVESNSFSSSRKSATASRGTPGRGIPYPYQQQAEALAALSGAARIVAGMAVELDRPRQILAAATSTLRTRTPTGFGAAS